MNDRASPCTSAGVNSEIAGCFRQEYDRADRELNDTYRRIMLALGEKEQASLRFAQLSWITYRDRACEAEAEPYRGITALDPKPSSHGDAERSAQPLRYDGRLRRSA